MLHHSCSPIKTARWFIWSLQLGNLSHATDWQFVCANRTLVSSQMRNHHMSWIGWQQGCHHVWRVPLLKAFNTFWPDHNAPKTMCVIDYLVLCSLYLETCHIKMNVTSQLRLNENMQLSKCPLYKQNCREQRFYKYLHIHCRFRRILPDKHIFHRCTWHGYDNRCSEEEVTFSLDLQRRDLRYNEV